MYRHTTFPAFGGESVSPAPGAFRIDPAGNLWVQEYPQTRDAPSSWQVFSPAGTLIGRLNLPPRKTVLDVGADFALLR